MVTWSFVRRVWRPKRVLPYLLGGAVACMFMVRPLQLGEVGIACFCAALLGGLLIAAFVMPPLADAEVLLARGTRTLEVAARQQKKAHAAGEQAMHVLLCVDSDMGERVEAAKHLAAWTGHPWPPYEVDGEDDDGES